jgi:hypothetical protein
MQETVGEPKTQMLHKEDEEPVAQGVSSALSAPFAHGREFNLLR